MIEIIKYKSLAELESSAFNLEKFIFETDISYSFRIYDKNGKTTQFHVIYK